MAELRYYSFFVESLSLPAVLSRMYSSFLSVGKDLCTNKQKGGF